MSDRFVQEDLRTLQDMESVLLSVANGCTHGGNANCHLVKLKNFDGLIDTKELVSELKELPVIVKLYNSEFPSSAVKNVTSVSTICDILNKKDSYKRCLPHLHKILLLYLAIPLASTTAQTIFSAMRRIYHPPCQVTP